MAATRPFYVFDTADGDPVVAPVADTDTVLGTGDTLPINNIIAAYTGPINSSKITIPATPSFWANSTPAPAINRVNDRLFLGAGTVSGGYFASGDGPTSWVGNPLLANYFWMERSALLFGVHQQGGMAGVFATRNSDKTGLTGHTTIGVTGFAVADVTLGSAVWGSYFEAQRRAGVDTVSYAGEVDSKNGGTRVETNPYNRWTTGATIGFFFAAGGDPSSNPPTNPSSNAILIGRNSHTWIKGIVFDAAGIEGTDGSTGTGTAISLAKGHELEWVYGSGAGGTNRSAVIRSDGNLAISQTRLVFDLTGWTVRGVKADLATEVKLFEVKPNQTGVNWLQVTGGSTGQQVGLNAVGDGTDANIPLVMTSYGTGTIRLRTNGGETAQVGLEVQNSAGAVDYPVLRGNLITVGGATTNQGLTVRAKGTGLVTLQDGNSNTQIQVGASKLGFFGAAPVAKPTLSAALATDGSATTTQIATAVNTLRTSLISLGLAQ